VQFVNGLSLTPGGKRYIYFMKSIWTKFHELHNFIVSVFNIYEETVTENQMVLVTWPKGTHTNSSNQYVQYSINSSWPKEQLKSK
jgi:hypothetical protein